MMLSNAPPVWEIEATYRLLLVVEWEVVTTVWLSAMELSVGVRSVSRRK